MVALFFKPRGLRGYAPMKSGVLPLGFSMYSIDHGPTALLAPRITVRASLHHGPTALPTCSTFIAPAGTVHGLSF